MPRKALIEKSKQKPKFSTRKVNRCKRCGRARSYYRFFQMCRICLRHNASFGLLPGVRKASW